MVRQVIPVVLIISASFLSVQAAISLTNTHWTDLTFDKGDVLQCDMNIFAYHALLATDSSHVAHIIGDKSSGTGRLVEESWESYHNREGTGQTNCRKEFKAPSPNLSVEKAREDIERYNSRNIYYSLLHCNCEHWAMKWATGEAKSNQASSFGISSSCDALRHPVTRSDFETSAAGTKTTNGGKCYSECTLWSNGKYYCNRNNGSDRLMTHCSPRRGATYKGNNCAGECQRYLDYFFCYTDSNQNWDYCGPSE